MNSTSSVLDYVVRCDVTSLMERRNEQALIRHRAERAALLVTYGHLQKKQHISCLSTIGLFCNLKPTYNLSVRLFF